MKGIVQNPSVIDHGEDIPMGTLNTSKPNPPVAKPGIINYEYMCVCTM